MTFLTWFVLILAILCWIVGSHYEWSIPLKWQANIRALKERFSNKSHSLYFIWDLDPENEEMEKSFWHLQKELPGLQMKYKLPLWIEVRVNPNLSLGQKDKYISCLQRRFSKINIYEAPLDGEGGSEEKNTAKQV